MDEHEIFWFHARGADRRVGDSLYPVSGGRAVRARLYRRQ